MLVSIDKLLCQTLSNVMTHRFTTSTCVPVVGGGGGGQGGGGENANLLTCYSVHTSALQLYYYHYLECMFPALKGGRMGSSPSRPCWWWVRRWRRRAASPWCWAPSTRSWRPWAGRRAAPAGTAGRTHSHPPGTGRADLPPQNTGKVQRGWGRGIKVRKLGRILGWLHQCMMRCCLVVDVPTYLFA